MPHETANHYEFPSFLGLSFGVCKSGEIIDNAEALNRWVLVTKKGHSLSSPDEIKDLLGGNLTREVRPGPYQTTAFTMACEAVQQCLLPLSDCEKKKIAAIFATTTFPAHFNTRLPRKNNLSLAIREKFQFSPETQCKDTYAACSGGIYLLDKIDNQQTILAGKRILIVATERYSGYLDDPFHKLIFSDKAVALTFTLGQDLQIIKTCTHHYGDPKNILQFPLDPVFNNLDFCEFALPSSSNGNFQMDGHAVQRFTYEEPKKLTQEILAETQLQLSDIKLIILHQANGKTIQSAQKHFGEEKVFPHYQEGNASSASIFLALRSALSSGKIQRGDKVILEAFGGGLSSGACLIQFKKE